MHSSASAAGKARREFPIAAGAALVPGATLAQEYPSKAIRIVSPFSPGATSDLVARAIGPALATAWVIRLTWGVSVVAENKPGGGSIVGADFVAKAAPDGHTLLVAAAAIGVNPALMTIDGGPHVLGHIRSGALRMLAVATQQRLPEFPDTPTIAESGFPGFESNAWQSMWVTGGTAPAATRKIATEVMRIIHTPEMSEHLKAMGMQPIGSTPEEAEKFIRAETAQWGAVIKASGARAE